jgi:16S rRNA G966 N2-methylase RsmD
MLLKNGQKTIAELYEQLNIPRPSIRKILGQGAIKGQFTRVAKGVYTLRDQRGNDLLWIEQGDSVEVLSDFVMEGRKFDMIFLDPPYYSKQLVGRNRLKQKDWYEFITPDRFQYLAIYCTHLLRTPDSPVYLMLSGAESAKEDMLAYYDTMENAGFVNVGAGYYKKKYRNGNPVLNIRGKESAAEKVYIFTRSGKLQPGQIPYPIQRKWVAMQQVGYRTQKAIGVLSSIVRQSTLRGQHVLDAFGGSGAMVSACIDNGRRLTIIEKSIKAVENFIVNHVLRSPQSNLL